MTRPVAAGAIRHGRHYPDGMSTERQPLTAPECVFCRIVAGEVPATIVAADDELSLIHI